MEVLEAEKLLLTIYNANRLKILLTTEEINSHIYLLRSHYEIPFYYTFRFNPLPYSEELVEDLESLRYGGNVSFGSPIIITDKGVERIERRKEDLKSLSERIEKALTEMSGWDDKLLFQAIYNTITI